MSNQHGPFSDMDPEKPLRSFGKLTARAAGESVVDGTVKSVKAVGSGIGYGAKQLSKGALYLCGIRFTPDDTVMNIHLICDDESSAIEVVAKIKGKFEFKCPHCDGKHILKNLGKHKVGKIVKIPEHQLIIKSSIPCA